VILFIVGRIRLELLGV